MLAEAARPLTLRPLYPEQVAHFERGGGHAARTRHYLYGKPAYCKLPHEVWSPNPNPNPSPNPNPNPNPDPNPNPNPNPNPRPNLTFTFT